MAGHTSKFPVVKGETATVAASGTTSGTIDKEGSTLCGLMTPAALTSTSITFKGGVTAASLLPVKDKYNTAISITCGTAEAAFYVLEPGDFAGMRYVQLVTGSTEVAERVFTLAMRPV